MMFHSTYYNQLFQLLCLLSIITSLSTAAKPVELSVNLKDGNFDGVESLNPTLSCVGSSTEGDIEFTYGLDIALNPTRNVKSLPRTIWGKAKASIGGWVTSIRAEVNAQALDCFDFVITSDKNNLSLKAIGSYSGSNKNPLVSKVQGTKIYKDDATKTKLSITPRYNIETEEADVIIEYVQDKAEFEIIASDTSQQITLSQQLNLNNRIGTTLTNYGDVSFEWEHCYDFNHDGDSVKSVTTTLKPNECLNVHWKDRDWVTDVNVPMDGIMDMKGLNVAIKRQLKF